MSKRQEATMHLFPAAAAGNLLDVQADLDDGANVNAKDGSGMTPLHWAIECGHPDMVKLLIAKGADMHIVTAVSHQTPLHLAAALGHRDIVTLLIGYAGADISAKNARQQTPVHLALANNHPDIVELLDNVAKEQGHAGRVTEERKDKGPPQVGG